MVILILIVIFNEIMAKNNLYQNKYCGINDKNCVLINTKNE